MTDENGNASSGTEHMEAIDSMGWDSSLKVLVRDKRDGKIYHIDFKRSVHGEYKHDGGGGYKDESRFEAAKTVAKHYVQSELSRTVVPKSEWTTVKPLVAKRILENHPDYEVRKVDTGSERHHSDETTRKKGDTDD